MDNRLGMDFGTKDGRSGGYARGSFSTRVRVVYAERRKVVFKRDANSVRSYEEV